MKEVEALSEDEALKSFLGIERFPDESSVEEWLRKVGEEGVEAARRIVREFVAWALERAEPPRYQHGGQVECFFDDTQLEVYGRSFEGAQVNYEGKLALGWPTWWVGPFLVDGVLGYAGDESSQLRPLLETNRALWEREKAYRYVDTASSAGRYVARRRGPQDLCWSYGFVTTHEQEGTAQAVFERHRLKGEMERRFSEVLSDLDLHHPPCASLSANRVYYALAMLAYNVLQALKLIWLPATEQSRRVRTLIHRLLLIPVRIQRHGRHLTARFYVPVHGLRWWRTFFREMLPRGGLAPPCAVRA